MYSLRYCFESFRTMIHGIHRRYICKQCLCCADIAGCFITLDMLLACLQCHTKRYTSLSIYRNADDATRNLSFIFFFGCEKCRMWSAITHGNTKSLCGTKDDVSTEFSRWFEKRECEQVTGTCNQSAMFMSGIKKLGKILNGTICGRILKYDAENRTVPLNV